MPIQFPTRPEAANATPVGIIVVKFLIYITIIYASTDFVPRYPENKKQI